MIVFIDESGFLLSPLVKRTWAPVGQTPVLKVRLGHWKKVSAISALLIPPTRRRPVELLFRFLPGQNVNKERSKEFLEELQREVPRKKLLIIWDRLSAHVSALVNALIEASPRLERHYLPPYAPELNPVEYVWDHLKYHALANYTPATVEDLHRRAEEKSKTLQGRQDLIRSFLAHCPLAFD